MVDSALSPYRSYLALRIFLVLFSSSEFLSAVNDLSSLLTPNPTSATGWHVAGYISDARTIVAPGIAAAAFGFTLMGMLSRGIAMMAALLLIKAFSALAWAIALWGAPVPLDVYSIPILAPRYVYPLLGVVALVLLWRGRLGLAGTMAMLPTAATWLYWIIAVVVIATLPD
jgi:hypothetical protein